MAAVFYVPTARPDADEAFQALTVSTIRNLWATHIRRYGYPPEVPGMDLDAYWCNFRWRVYLRTDAGLPANVHRRRKARLVRAEILDAYRRWYDMEHTKESSHERAAATKPDHQTAG